MTYDKESFLAGLIVGMTIARAQSGVSSQTQTAQPQPQDEEE